MVGRRRGVNHDTLAKVGKQVVEQCRSGIVAHVHADALPHGAAIDRVVDDPTERHRGRRAGAAAGIATEEDARLAARGNDVVDHHHTRDEPVVVEHRHVPHRTGQGSIRAGLPGRRVDADAVVGGREDEVALDDELTLVPRRVVVTPILRTGGDVRPLARAGDATDDDVVGVDLVRGLKLHRPASGVRQFTELRTAADLQLIRAPEILPWRREGFRRSDREEVRPVGLRTGDDLTAFGETDHDVVEVAALASSSGIRGRSELKSQPHVSRPGELAEVDPRLPPTRALEEFLHDLIGLLADPRRDRREGRQDPVSRIGIRSRMGVRRDGDPGARPLEREHGPTAECRGVAQYDQIGVRIDADDRRVRRNAGPGDGHAGSQQARREHRHGRVADRRIAEPRPCADSGSTDKRAGGAGLDPVVEVQRRLVGVRGVGEAERQGRDRRAVARELQRDVVIRARRGSRDRDLREAVDRHDRGISRDPGTGDRHPRLQSQGRRHDHRRVARLRGAVQRGPAAAERQVRDGGADPAGQVAHPGRRHHAHVSERSIVHGGAFRAVEAVIDARPAQGLGRQVLAVVELGIPRVIDGHHDAVTRIATAHVRRPPEVDVERREGQAGEVPVHGQPGVVGMAVVLAEITVEDRKQGSARVKAIHPAILVDGEQLVGEIAWRVARPAGDVLRAEGQALERRALGYRRDHRGLGRRAVDREQVPAVVDAVQRVTPEGHAGRESQCTAGGLNHATHPAGAGVTGGDVREIETRHSCLYARVSDVAHRIEQLVEQRCPAHRASASMPCQSVDTVGRHAVGVGDRQVTDRRERRVGKRSRLRDGDVAAPRDGDLSLGRDGPGDRLLETGRNDADGRERQGSVRGRGETPRPGLGRLADSQARRILQHAGERRPVQGRADSHVRRR